jgi:hypothetical protein
LRPSGSTVQIREPNAGLFVPNTIVVRLPSRLDVNASRPSGNHAGPASYVAGTCGRSVSSPLATSTSTICASLACSRSLGRSTNEPSPPTSAEKLSLPGASEPRKTANAIVSPSNDTAGSIAVQLAASVESVEQS